jgi:sugar phosphate isomerase/epimerase
LAKSEIPDGKWPPIGFITNVLFNVGVLDFSAVLDFAIEEGFDCLTVGPTYALSDLEQAPARGVRISDLQYCRNLLTTDESAAQQFRKELVERIEVASRLGIPIVTISSGILERGNRSPIYDTYDSIRRAPLESIDEFERVYGPLVALAEKRSVTLAVENCPIMGNWAISPYLWERMFERIPSPSLGLTFDPGHLAWQFMDPYKPIQRFAGRIVHVHGKDVEILDDALKDRGILTDSSWFRFRIPGWGILDWRRIMDELRLANYAGALSIEHEDPLFLGSLDRVKAGLISARRHLRWAEDGSLA